MIVVTDTSVVLNLCWLHREALLPAIYSGILAPGEVAREFARQAATEPRFAGLRFPGFIVVADPIFIPAALAANRDLDPGETAALALALERGIRDVLIDERAGRAAALALGLHVAGLLAVLVEAKQRGLIPELRPLLHALISGARFWIGADLREQALRRAGENPDT